MEFYHQRLSQTFLHGMCLDVEGTGAIAWGLSLLQVKVNLAVTNRGSSNPPRQRDVEIGGES
jgi:hypothetical protein